MNEISIKKATTIYGAAKYCTIIISILFSAILSRILTPNDYGIVAIITIFTTFFSILSDMGLGTAVIQNKELTENDTNSIFVFSMYISLILAIIFCLLSIPISIIYNNHVYIPICCVLSISIIFNTLNMIPNALLLKSKKFMAVGSRMVIVNVITGSFGAAFALLGFKYYALIYQSIISSILTFLWNLKSSGLKITFRYERNSIEKVKSFGGFQFAFNLVNYFARNLDNLLIGKLMGNSQLAYYDKGYKLMLYPVSNLTLVISPILHPVLSGHQDEKKYIYDQYVKIVKILSLAGVFITVFSFISGREIIMILYGRQWESSVICFKILSLSIFFQMTVSSAGPIYQSIGNTKLMFKSGLIFTTVMVTCILIGVFTGNINKVAFAVTISLIFKFFIDYYFLIQKCMQYSVVEFFKIFVPDMIIFVLLFSVMHFATLFRINNTFLMLIYKFISCMVTFSMGLVITKQYKYFIILLPYKLKNKLIKFFNRQVNSKQ